MTNTNSAEVLPDLLRPGLDLVICGTAASKQSAAQSAYYADHSNRFWSILARTGLTHRRLAPCEYELLLEFDIGLTDLVKRYSGTDAGLRADQFDVGEFRDKIENARPRVLAFNGKKAASIHFGVKTKHINYGRQSSSIGGAVLFVLPHTSGNACAYWEPGYWHACACHIRRFRSAPG